MNKLRTTAATSVAVALATASFAMATAAPAQSAPQPKPKFLAAKELPGKGWKADKVKPGKTFDTCYSKALPTKGSSYRTFRVTNKETGAEQTTTVASSTAQAKKLVSSVRDRIANCLERLKKEDKKLKGQEKYYGKVGVEEGAHVYGVATVRPNSAYDVNLFSVGRDGRTVTVVGWGEFGTLKSAPVKAFKKTTKTAVAKLY
ncbi:hypothetical protein [Streptomyces yaizuensis]|uniref:Sensor domain-containing protein n=1 Tax=Streptomyces yaizuensis TaxID=2989713 RepID=A0ABQ5PB97_9ACTN|nr:hypothetical protein [Streptomyces sp. YSPA8]GLF99840.1 sensor domain-containing protein [Streptomyces sp. YSPA8]